MNWKLLLPLSLLGLVMAAATVSLIPQKVEVFFWLAIMVFCAYMIATKCTGKYFLHGFMLSLLNCVWIVALHTTFCSTYMLNHPGVGPKDMQMPPYFWTHLREAMLLTGPFFGAGFGLIQGLFAFIASKIVKKEPTSTVA